MKKIVKLLSIVLLVTLLVFSTGCKKKDNDSNNSDSPITEIDEKVNKIVSYYRLFGECDSGIDFDFTTKEKYLLSDLDKEILYQIAFNYLMDNNKVNKIASEEEIKNSFSAEDLYSTLKLLFGNEFVNTLVIPKTIVISNREFTVENGIYSGPVIMGNCLNNTSVNYKYSGYELKDGVYSVKFNIYWKTTELNGEGKVTEKYFDDKELSEAHNALEELPLSNVVSFNFKEENGNLVLKDITK